MRAAAIAAAFVSALALAGCGSDAGSAVDETAANLSKIRSGDLTMRAIIAPQGGEELGLELEGPFSIANEGLAVTEMKTTRIVGAQRVEATVISDGEQAWVRADGTLQKLTAEQSDSLQVRSGGGGLAQLEFDLGSWISDPETSQDGDIERITGGLDMKAALTDLADSAGQKIPEDVRQRLVDAVRESKVVVVTGREDRLLRELTVRATIDVPRDLEPVIGTAGLAELTLDVRLEAINQPVEVQPPA